MRLFIYTGDDTTIRHSIANNKYCRIRAHYYSLTRLAEVLGFNDILEYNESKEIDKTVKGSELDFTKYSFNPATTNTESDVLVVLHCRVHDKILKDLPELFAKFNKVIYYSSDPELSECYKDSDLLLSYLLREDRELIYKFHGIIFGLGYTYTQAKLSNLHPNIHYLPQLVNPNVPRLDNSKKYDVFILNNCMGSNEYVKQALDAGLSVLNYYKYDNLTYENPRVCNVKDPEWSTNYLEYIEVISNCSYYLNTNSDSLRFMINLPQIVFNDHSFCSRYLESYYARTIPLPASASVELIRDLDYSKVLIDFDKWINEVANFNDEQIKQIDVFSYNNGRR